MLKTKEEIINWLNKYKIENYTVNEDLTVDVNDDVDFYKRKIKAIPIQFNKIVGYFDCSYCELTSLEGCPKEVTGSFYCSYNELITLKNGPEKVGGFYLCNDNKLKTLEFSPKQIYNTFTCSNNKLNSLKYCPENLSIEIHCRGNKFKDNTINKLEPNQITQYLLNKKLNEKLNSSINSNANKKMKI